MKIDFKKFLTVSLAALYLVFANYTTIYAQELQISAESAIVMDAQTGFILYDKNMHELQYPASIVKVMTGLIAMEQYGDRLYEPIEFSNHAVYSIPWNSSHIAMNEGETLTMEDALYALMLASANEVANAIAEHISGDVNIFAQLMTRRANALGATNTVFTNPSGLHDPKQVTTAYDMALIMREASRHPRLLEIMGTVRHDIPPTERQPEVRPLRNSNRILWDNQHFNDSVIGGKTGFTTPAQHTLATFAKQDERELVVITLHGQGRYLYTDTNRLLNHAFAIPYVQTQLFYEGEYARTIPVYSNWGRNREQVGEVVLQVPENVYLELPLGHDMDLIETQLYTPSQVVMPVHSGNTIGRIIYSVGGNFMGDIQLKVANTVLPPSPVIPDPPLLPDPESNYEPVLTAMQAMAENYYLSFILPLAIFSLGLVFSVGLFRLHRNWRQAKGGKYSVIGSSVYRR